MKILWTFESQAKLDPFTVILEKHGMAYETTSKDKTLKSSGEITISVTEDDYVKARKLLMKHRKRRTSGDLM